MKKKINKLSYFIIAAIIIILTIIIIIFLIKNKDSYNSAEHAAVADGNKNFTHNNAPYDGIKLSYPSGIVLASNLSWSPSNNNGTSNIKLSFGTILALAGDLYGIPKQPIIPPRSNINTYYSDRFQQSFDTLRYADPTELSQLVNFLKDEIEKINVVLKNGKSVPDYYKSVGHSSDIELNTITGGGSDIIPDYFNESILNLAFKGRYMQLAQNNYDHFCENDHAFRAYMSGHLLACQYAANSGGNINMLTYAYAIEAFACHFLSDHFASGHLRTPRYELHQGRDCSVGNYEFDWNATSGDYCSKLMHDEDNKNGLWVANNACYEQNPDPKLCKVWKMYGDTMYFTSQNSVNVDRQLDAIQQSVNEVWQSFNTKINVTQKSSKVYLYLANLDTSKLIPVTDNNGNVVFNGSTIKNFVKNVNVYNVPGYFSKKIIVTEYSQLNKCPMFAVSDPSIYNCVYKRESQTTMTYIFSPFKTAMEFELSSASIEGGNLNKGILPLFMAGVTHYN